MVDCLRDQQDPTGSSRLALILLFTMIQNRPKYSFIRLACKPGPPVGSASPASNPTMDSLRPCLKPLNFE